MNEINHQQPRYTRILLKMSGEALMGEQDFGLDATVVRRIAGEVAELNRLGIEVAIVIGGGNLFRGAQLAALGMERVAGDHMGMLATLMNALAMQDALEQLEVPVRVMSALRVDEICEPYIRRRAVRHLEEGRVVICAAGTGNPFFTTDTAASLRAVELGVNAMFKATKVDGIYSKDPKRYVDAVKYERLTYQQVLTENLQVMDGAAVVMCRDNHLPLLVFDMTKEGEIVRAVFNDDVGTVVSV